jgi:hypothetical protein
MPQLRVAPSGPVIVGQNNDDVLLWDVDLKEWIAGPIPSSIPSPVADWYVNAATGNDSNSGTSPSEAFATTERLSAVLCPGGAALTIAQDTTVHIAAGAYGRLALNIDNPTATALFLSIVGEISSGAPIVLATVTNSAPTGPTRGRITTLSGAFTNHTRLRCTAGSNVGAVAYVTGVTSALDAFVSGWLDPLVNVVNLSAADEVVEDTLLVSIAHFDLKQRSFGGIILQDIECLTGGEMVGASAHDAIQLYRCNLGGQIAGVGTAVSSAFTIATNFENGTFRLFGNVYRALVDTENAVLRLSQRNCFDGGRLILQSASQAVFFSNPTGDCEFENGVGGVIALDVRAGCQLNAASNLWGVTGNYGTGVRVRSAAAVGYTVALTIPSTINAVVGGTNKAWAALPFNDPTHWCAMVVNA